MPNDRSTERLLQRKQVAEEAGKAHPGEWGTDIRYNLKMASVCADNGEPLCIVTDDEDVATATHIALSDPGTTQQDIEEIIKLRAENERLRGEVTRLDREADWLVKMLSHYTEDCPLKFKVVYEVRFPIPKIDQCSGQESDIEDCAYIPSQCWREAARKAVEETKNG